MRDPKDLLPAGLDLLLAELRARGLPIGDLEVGRLYHLFRRTPVLDLHGLETLLACTLVKRQEDREPFAIAFAEWCDRATGALATFAAPADQVQPTSRSTPLPSGEGLEDLPAALDRLAEPPQPVPRPWLRRAARAAALLLLIWPNRLSEPPWQQPIDLSGVLPGARALECADPASPRCGEAGTQPRPDPARPVLGLGHADSGLTEPAEHEDEQPEQNRSDDTSPPPLIPPGRYSIRTPDCAPEPVGELPQRLSSDYWTWVAQARIINQPPWLIACLGLSAWALAGLLWRRYRRHRPPPDPPQINPEAPDWLPLLSPADTGPELLDRDKLQRLVWGVERFATEQESQALDVGDTVSATARSGGLVDLRYEHTVAAREVWLWQDEALEDPSARRLGGEIARALTRVGLPVRRAFFVDVPDELRWDQGQPFNAAALEGHRQSALVAILTDGYGLGLARRSPHDRSRVRNLMAGLAQWPRLAFVDIADGKHGLHAIVARYGLRCIEPNDLPGFLGFGQASAPRQRPRPPALTGDLLAWAAATAVSSDPVDEGTAFELRRTLGLRVDPGRIGEFFEAGGAQRVGGHLTWAPRRRAELLNWLVRAERPDPRIPKQWLLARVLAYWCNWYRRQLAQRRRQESQGLLRWRDSLPERQLRMELALLDLWLDPTHAAPELFRLSKGGLRDVVGERLRHYAPADYRACQDKPGFESVIFLPWDYWDQPDTIRWMLTDAGLGAGALPPTGTPGMNALLAMVLAGCATAGSTAFIVAAQRTLNPRLAPDFELAVAPFTTPPFPALLLRDPPRYAGLGELRVVRGTPKLPFVMRLGPNARIAVDYRWQAQPNGTPVGNSRLWHAGYLAQPVRACDGGSADAIAPPPAWARRSLVVIDADRDDQAAQHLAARMLDLGGADAVLIGRDAPEQADAAFGERLAEMTDQDQLLLILTALPTTPDPPTNRHEYRVPPAMTLIEQRFPGRYAAILVVDLENLRTALRFAGSLPLARAWSGRYVLLAGDGDLPLRGGPRTTPGPIPDAHFVQVCRGTFTMGSNETGPAAEKDERPAHAVVLDTFWMAAHETTAAQLRSSIGRSRELALAADGSPPALGIDFDGARRYCRRLNRLATTANTAGVALTFDLPTEGQWEYAARGGISTPWPDGDTPLRLPTYAWLSATPGDGALPQVQPVMTKRPNALCLYDMLGNALESVLDCYQDSEYGTRQAENPVAVIAPASLQQDCRKRVVRGGAYDSKANQTRFGDRDYVYPWARDPALGFRCIGREP